VLGWKANEVGNWTVKIGHGELKKTFARRMDGLSLLLLTHSDLSQLGVPVWAFSSTMH
jgi:hypothetical protein